MRRRFGREMRGLEMISTAEERCFKVGTGNVCERLWMVSYKCNDTKTNMQHGAANRQSH